MRSMQEGERAVVVVKLKVALQNPRPLLPRLLLNAAVSGGKRNQKAAKARRSPPLPLPAAAPSAVPEGQWEEEEWKNCQAWAQLPPKCCLPIAVVAVLVVVMVVAVAVAVAVVVAARRGGITGSCARGRP